MKKLYILVLILLIPLVMGFSEESLLTTDLKVRFEREGFDIGRIVVTGENLEWNKVIYFNQTIPENLTEPVGFGPEWDEELEIIMLRRLGNYSDVQYAIIQCNQMANFSNEWRSCMDDRNVLELHIMDNMVNKTEYEGLEENITEQITSLNSQISTKTSEITTLEEEKKKLEQQRQYGWILAIGAGIGLGYMLYTYKGWGKRKHQMQGEYPSDISV